MNLSYSEEVTIVYIIYDNISLIHVTINDLNTFLLPGLTRRIISYKES